MKQVNNVPLLSWQTRAQTEKRRVPSPQHKQRGNPLNKCNFKLFFPPPRELEERLFPMCIQSVFAQQGTWNTNRHKFRSSNRIKHESLTSCILSASCTFFIPGRRPNCNSVDVCVFNWSQGLEILCKCIWLMQTSTTKLRAPMSKRCSFLPEFCKCCFKSVYYYSWTEDTLMKLMFETVSCIELFSQRWFISWISKNYLFLSRSHTAVLNIWMLQIVLIHSLDYVLVQCFWVNEALYWLIKQGWWCMLGAQSTRLSHWRSTCLIPESYVARNNFSGKQLYCLKVNK